MIEYVALYGFTRRKEGLRVRPQGVDRGSCLLYHAGGESAAVITPVDPKSFSTDATNMVLHEEAVETIAQKQVILPVKFPRIMTLRALKKNLSRLDPEFTRILRKIVYKAEFRVRVLLMDLNSARVPSIYYNAISQFFMERATQYQYKHFFPIMTKEAQEAEFVYSTEQIIQVITDRLCTSAMYWRAKSFHTDRVLMDAYFWTRRHQTGAFLREMSQLKSFYPNLHFSVLGPYPPYNFARIDLKKKQ